MHIHVFITVLWISPFINWRDVMASFHEPIRMSETLVHYMCSLTHATSSLISDHDVTD